MTRFVLCDEDELYTTVISSLLAERGIELVGVGTTTATSVALIEAARPDGVIVDFLLGYNSDFDIVATANQVGAAVIIFSRSADDALLASYDPPPTVVYKPDLTELGVVVDRLLAQQEEANPPVDRRRRPVRSVGPEPTGLSDAHAFYVALEEATTEDALIALELGPSLSDEQVQHLAEHVRAGLRGTDRLLVTRSLLRVFVPAAGSDGVPALLERLQEADALPPGATTKWVALAEGETGADAFERLKST